MGLAFGVVRPYMYSHHTAFILSSWKNKVILENQLICISRHNPARPVASNAVAEMQVMSGEIQVSVAKIQVFFVEM